MKPTVYVETTIISYLTAWPSRDLIRAAQQQMTNDWWTNARPRFDLFTSELVVVEASAGDPDAARARLDALVGLNTLQVTNAATDLADLLTKAGAVPAVAARDALHIGLAVTNGIDFLLTWNFRHLANAFLRARIVDVCEDAGYRGTTICTPEELSEILP